jgi:hypothetical protein
MKAPFGAFFFALEKHERRKHGFPGINFPKINLVIGNRSIELIQSKTVFFVLVLGSLRRCKNNNLHK